MQCNDILLPRYKACPHYESGLNPDQAKTRLTRVELGYACPHSTRFYASSVDVNSQDNA